MTEQQQDKIFVGDKPIFAYIKSIEIQISRNPKVIIGARGKFINKLVNIAEISKRNGFKVTNIEIGTNPFKTKEGKEIFVSFMEISMSK